MQFVFKIGVDNDAFTPDPSWEIARLLELAATQMRETGTATGESQSLRDVNGNTVGFYALRDAVELP